MSNPHPLRQALDNWLPELDFAVLSHGFASHGRDYVLVIQAAAGTHRLTLTHVPEVVYETRVRGDVWSESWDDCFTEYAAWQAQGEPEGYVWGTNWSLAYPGLQLPETDASATRWSERFRQPMYAILIETDRFKLRLVFHDIRTERLSDDSSVVDQVLIPLAP